MTSENDNIIFRFFCTNCIKYDVLNIAYVPNYVNIIFEQVIQACPKTIVFGQL